MDSGGSSEKKRAVLVWHRRAGKEKTIWNYTVKAACERVGSYYYFFPTNVQARKVLWDGMDAAGFKFLDHIPKPLRDGEPNSTEMKIRLRNGSIIQILGTDNYDMVRGTNPVGCVFSEYSYQDPAAWDTFRPIMRENKGWAIFNFTPNGRNHAYKLYQMAASNPDWYNSVLTIEDTGVLTKEEIDEERATGMDEEKIQQEYYCSFSGITVGTYYGHEMERLENVGQITAVPYDPKLTVDTWWDLGMSDSTAIWFTQTYGRSIRVIDCYENSGEGLKHYISILREKNYLYGIHNAPHDIEVRELGTGKSRKETAESLGLRFNVIERLSFEDGIEAARNIIPICWFDKDKCKRGIEALIQYHKEFDEKRAAFKNSPTHDWSSHYCIIAGTIIATDRGNISIEQVKIGDKVITPFGKSSVLAAGLVKKASDLLEITTSKGNILTVTPEHKIFYNNLLANADTLRYNDILYSKSIWSELLWKTWKLLFIKDMNLGFREIIISGLAQKHCIKLSGNITMGQFLKVMLFTIKTEIQLIMTLIISKLLPEENTKYCMEINQGGMDLRKILNNWKKHEKRLLNGMEERKGQSFIRRSAKCHGNIGRNLFVNAMYVLRNILQHIQVDQIFVQMPVGQNKEEDMEKTLQNGLVSSVIKYLKEINILKPERVAKIVRISCKVEPRPVYDLTIEKDHCYYANNILVSNSDSFRYMAIGHKFLEPIPDKPKRYHRKYGYSTGGRSWMSR